MSTFQKVYAFAAHGKRYMHKAFLLLTSSAVIGIVPYIAVYLIIMRLTGGQLTAGFGVGAAGVILLSLLLKSHTQEKGLAASHRLAYDTLMGMRQKAADKLLSMPMGEIERYGSGALKKIFVEDIEGMELILAHAIPEGVGNIIGLCTVVVTLFIADWRLALCALAVIPFGFLALSGISKTATQKLELYYQASREMNSTIIEYVSGMEVIKVFGQGESAFSRYRKAIEGYKKFSLNWYKSCWKYMSMYNVFLPTTLLFALPAAILFYTSGSLSFGLLVLCVLLAMSMGPMLLHLVIFFPIIPNLRQKFKRIEDLFEETELPVGHDRSFPDGYGVSFHNVTFAYQDIPVLKDVSFEARAGGITAIVGESGAGKSTVAKLTARFWDVGEGSIRIGGRDIREYAFEALMDTISYVSQDNFLFNQSIMENIQVGRPGASDEDVMEMAKKAQCHDFIMEMPQGYQTVVGEAGDRLSGGQRQRITIARAMLKNAPIVLLDEATSSTDAENEDLIQEALNQLLRGKTVLVIAHRLSTVVDADHIIVLKAGKVIVQGKHPDLLQASTEYAHMWQSYRQSARWEYKTERKVAESC
ncbi:ATP-binding cassette, subfamily B [Sporobacter termitidis DSM 10068]|uniref:ATP-binding cassette, subfamily B n=2 Tax=Sporobacter TaxID=44748 RepID=A0A1M5W5T6_9FIRM|nr:ATP-binding cassette, subfamily B [Sporobacter termitidis DSM 10068]